MQPFVYHQAVKFLECHYRDFLRILLPPAAGILAMAGSISGSTFLWHTNSGIGVFCLRILIGIIFYILGLLVCDRFVGLDTKQMIVEQFKVLVRKSGER